MPDGVTGSDRDKIAVIAEAQKDGRVSERCPPEKWMMPVTGLSFLGAPPWTPADDQKRRRCSPAEAVRVLTEGEKP